MNSSPNQPGALQPLTALDALRVCQVIDSLNENTGGPVPAVVNLTEGLVQDGVQSYVVTQDYPNWGTQVQPQGAQCYSYPGNSVMKYMGTPNAKFYKTLRYLAESEINLIHNHGIWLFINRCARYVATANQLPLVISPRGTLEPWVFERNFYKKWLTWHLFEQQNLRHAALFHATSALELNAIRRLGFTQPIALIPDGVNLPDLATVPGRDILIQAFPELANKRWLLFMSRLHPKKGIDTLLIAWQRLATEFVDWHLIIAGPDENTYKTQLVKLVNECGLEQRVTFTGMLKGDRKAAALGNADLFVLPTHSENFGIVIAESLAYEVPVVTTQEAPWSELNTHNCGWWVKDALDTLIDALTEGLRLSESQRQTMGSRGRQLIADKYTWQAVVHQMVAAYEWATRGGNPPNCIIFEKGKGCNLPQALLEADNA
ncbi:MAG: glycosyltransferase [Tildeniella nuda ZEHNDER 1965/U140]|jgi:glycosyltransferase involved in cell wall biosynthesis|nr:glycosyltransferase [Tildeniella nuda ZEHNDER 1965/U140]